MAPFPEVDGQIVSVTALSNTSVRVVVTKPLIEINQDTWTFVVEDADGSNEDVQTIDLTDPMAPILGINPNLILSVAPIIWSWDGGPDGWDFVGGGVLLPPYFGGVVPF